MSSVLMFRPQLAVVADESLADAFIEKFSADYQA